MSRSLLTPNRREALKMLFGTVAGATLLGGATYINSINYADEKAENDARDIYASGQFDGLEEKQIADILGYIYKQNIGKLSLAATGLGALVGNVYYDWFTPDGADYDFDLDY